jgi:hypothetical protein
MGALALTELHTIRRMRVDIPSLTADRNAPDPSDPEPQRCEAGWVLDAGCGLRSAPPATVGKAPGVLRGSGLGTEGRVGA